MVNDVVLVVIIVESCSAEVDTSMNIEHLVLYAKVVLVTLPRFG